MTWEEATVRIGIPLLVAALVALSGFLLRLWKTSNPARQERHYRQVGRHENLLTEHSGDIDGLKERARETRGQGERIARIEERMDVEFKNFRSTTGEMKLDLKELLRHARANGGK